MAELAITKVFEHFSDESSCFLCGKNTDTPCVLVEVDGTAEGNICQAEPIHTDCLQTKLRINREIGLIYGRRR